MKDNDICLFVEHFDIDKLTESVLSLVEAAADGQSHQFRNQQDIEAIEREIARRNDAISRLQAILASKGEGTKAHVEDYLEHGTLQAEDKAVAEAQAWIKRSAAPSYLHSVIIAEARKSVDQDYYIQVQGMLDFCQSSGVNLMEDVNYEKEKWELDDSVVSAIHAARTQQLDSRQVSDLLLWHLKDKLDSEFTKRGYGAIGMFDALPISPQALTIIYSPAQDHRNAD